MIRFCCKCQTETERYGDGVCKPCKAKYRAANREKACESAAKWRADNQDKRREYDIKYRAMYYSSNKDKVREYNDKWRAENLDRVRAASSAYQSANLDKFRVYEQNRRARKRESGGKLSIGLAERLFRLQRGKCACCGQPLGNDYHLDHIMPLALGGSNTDDNMQLLRGSCNLKKGAKHPVEFMQSRGFLL